MTTSTWKTLLARRSAAFLLLGVLVVGGVTASTSSANALTAADMTTAQCQGLATGADCLDAASCDGSYTILASTKSCDVSWSIYAGKCCVKKASFVCNGTCKASVNTSAGEWNDAGGSKACAVNSPNTPFCASTSGSTGTGSTGSGTGSTGTGSTGSGTGTTGTGSTGSGTGSGTGTTGTGSTGSSAGTTTGGATTISFENPLKYNTVQDVLGSLLTTLQGIVVVLAIIFIIIGALLYITSAGDSKRMEAGKAAITAALIGLALVLAAPSFLKETSSILGWNNTPANVSGSLSLLAILTNVLNFLLGIVGILSIIMLVIGALMYLTAAGDEDRIDDGKKTVKYSIVGIIIAFAALVLVKEVATFFM